MNKTVITYRTLRENVADIIKQKILNHVLEPGMRVLEQDLAQELGISRGPIREALRQLEQEGLVEYTQNRGCTVRNITLLDVVEAFAIRGSYELTAARALRGEIPDSVLAQMGDIVERMKHMKIVEAISLDNMFHRLLITSANLPYLAKAWDNLDFVTFFSFYNEIDTENMMASERQYNIHKKIYDVYCKKDLKEICNTIANHYYVSIERKLKEHGLSEDDLNYSLDLLR